MLGNSTTSATSGSSNESCIGIAASTKNSLQKKIRKDNKNQVNY